MNIQDKMYKNCRLCNRPLKTEESRLRGYGNICYCKLQRHPNRLFPVWQGLQKAAKTAEERGES